MRVSAAVGSVSGRQDKSVAVVGRLLLVQSMGYGGSRRKGLLALLRIFQ